MVFLVQKTFETAHPPAESPLLTKKTLHAVSIEDSEDFMMDICYKIPVGWCISSTFQVMLRTMSSTKTRH